MIGEIYEGMKVRALDGTKLGKIEKIGDGFFTIEKGLFSKERHELKFGDVREIRDDEAIVAWAGDVETAGTVTSSAGSIETGRRTFGREQTSARSAGELRVPLAEEELEVGKTVHEAGRVRVTKHVEVEDRQITVPVMHEEVEVERVPASGASAPAWEDAFKEMSFTIPVREEEIEIRKRPVIREEVRVATSAYDEEESIREPLRKEVAEVETEGEVRRAPGRDSDKY